MPVESIPEDLIIEIMSKLPVKSLLRFKSLSKSLNSNITGKQFTEVIHSGPTRLLVHSFDNNLGFYRYQSLDFKADFEFLQLPWSNYRQKRGENILGYVNGLVLLGFNRARFRILNPSTGYCKKLLKPKISSPFNLYNYGFGYDNSIDDYKVVSIANQPFNRIEVEVLSLETNTWRRINQDMKFVRFSLDSEGILVGNVLHWLAYSESFEQLIVGFDLSNENFGFVPIPYYHKPKFFCTRPLLAVLRGCLCFCYTYYDYEDSSYISMVDIWIMKEYGVIDSWTKLMTIPSQFNFRPLCLTNDGEYLVGMSRLAFLKWNIQRKQFQDTMHVGYSCKAISYNESLVTLNYQPQNGEIQSSRRRDQM